MLTDRRGIHLVECESGRRLLGVALEVAVVAYVSHILLKGDVQPFHESVTRACSDK